MTIAGYYNPQCAGRPTCGECEKFASCVEASNTIMGQEITSPEDLEDCRSIPACSDFKRSRNEKIRGK